MCDPDGSDDEYDGAMHVDKVAADADATTTALPARAAVSVPDVGMSLTSMQQPSHALAATDFAVATQAALAAADAAIQADAHVLSTAASQPAADPVAAATAPVVAAVSAAEPAPKATLTQQSLTIGHLFVLGQLVSTLSCYLQAVKFVSVARRSIRNAF